MSMRLKNLRATAHPDGNRIDLSWELPEQFRELGLVVMRREGAFAAATHDGTEIAMGERLTAVSDTGLKAETVYYYSIFIYRHGSPPTYYLDRHNRVAMMSTGPYNMAGQIYDLLPAIYKRYDTQLPVNPPVAMTETDRMHGQLRRLLELPGGQLDQIYSFARALLHLTDLEHVDGRLLPLLAAWIGWNGWLGDLNPIPFK
ncbi:hypothetical protein EYB53_020480 [Candidatus Chloroploca sp. M-50]|uniref:Uncharacterized protein n=1 Tax=Candidatus Chloroploca mongolica TaxID=2528176 RepID=A0ABS4DF96_9CHLR|nr:hypothetical protein [Candidatus Chloroploca mongolica]MBP1468102.1 hypothetical protein [Candidatus Chloroploca mongolica]